MHAQRAGPAGNRRGDLGVLQIQLGVLDRRTVRGEGRLERVVARALGLVLIARNQAALEQILVAGLLSSALLAVAVSRASTASACCKRRLEGPRIEAEEPLALPDVLAFRK